MIFQRALLTSAILAAAGSLAACAVDTDSRGNAEVPGLIELSVLGSYVPEGDVFDESAAEIIAHDPSHQRLFVVNAKAATVDVLDISNPATPALIDTIDASREGASANSVAVYGDLVAVAIEAEVKQAKGKVVFYDSSDLSKVGEVTVGALPDMVTFTRDGQKVLVANEGEPSDDYTTDPEGSVSVIDLASGVANATVKTADFRAYNGREQELRESGIRIFGPGASAAQDFEPEFIAVSQDNTRAWVTLQENNAVAVLDIESARIVDVLPLGFKDHRLLGNEMDASNKDGGINLQNWPVKGMYQPDAIASYGYNGKTYYITANEGDSRDYDGFSEEFRVKDLQLSEAFGNEAQRKELQDKANLGRLKVTSTLGVINGCDPANKATDVEKDCVFGELYSYGARSFSIWNEHGQRVFDSGNDFERITANLIPEGFNATNDENGVDDRSDDKGPEPEAVAVGEIQGQNYAFIGLERVGGIMVYNVTNPQRPQFVQYLNNRDFSVSTAEVEAGKAGDLGPEGMAFIRAEDSPVGQPILAVGNEVSGTTTLYRIEVAGASTH
ncbi:choice-of-anchor I family protein [Marinobacter sp. S0848L]|uniref:choice-of-anchor I family protein n=1 Tax=Marinobacter sp. S0848L TaxID=2926423 RepID=UPI001FF60D4C|nr:choice-of-anchor I family protein [Marinobacter sp. S0848L]MCK0105216.1 choice-of-anchor I family protein [Marinobacter sp. S0848L]